MGTLQVRQMRRSSGTLFGISISGGPSGSFLRGCGLSFAGLSFAAPPPSPAFACAPGVRPLVGQNRRGGFAGTGAVAGYVGMASAVATLGLGGATTAITSAAGITAASGGTLVGAAATSARTAAVGGPVVAAVAVVGTVGAVGDADFHAVRRVASLFD
jgi:hypothetical protein